MLSIPAGSFVRVAFPSEGSGCLVWLVPAVPGCPVAPFRSQLVSLGCVFLRSCAFQWSGSAYVASLWQCPPAVLAAAKKCPPAPGGGSRQLGVGLPW
jgi:hypothetical protein